MRAIFVLKKKKSMHREGDVGTHNETTIKLLLYDNNEKNTSSTSKRQHSRSDFNISRAPK